MKTRRHYTTADVLAQTRREFLNTTASGLGMAALGGMLTQDGVLSLAQGAESSGSQPADVNPLAPRPPHFPGKAKRVIDKRNI